MTTLGSPCRQDLPRHELGPSPLAPRQGYAGTRRATPYIHTGAVARSNPQARVGMSYPSDRSPTLPRMTEIKDALVQVRMTRPEKAELRERAESRGLTLTQ